MKLQIFVYLLDVQTVSSSAHSNNLKLSLKDLKTHRVGPFKKPDLTQYK